SVAALGHAQGSLSSKLDAICISTSGGLLSTNLPLLPRRLQLPVALRVDLLLSPRQRVLRRDIARCTVQSDTVVMLDVALHQTPRIVQRQWRSWPDSLPFERFVPPLDLPIRLWVKRRGADVRHARDPNELFEIFGEELWAIVRDDARSRFRVLLLGSL